jgi:hypothetical protein
LRANSRSFGLRTVALVDTLGPMIPALPRMAAQRVVRIVCVMWKLPDAKADIRLKSEKVKPETG